MISTNKKVLALCVTLALSNNAFAGNTAATSDGCPADLSKLTKLQKEALPAQCLYGEHQNWVQENAPWLAGLVAAVGLGAGFSGLGSHSHGSAHANNADNNGDNGGNNNSDNGGNNNSDNGGNNNSDNGGNNNSDNGGNNNSDNGGNNNSDNGGNNNSDNGGNNSGDNGGNNNGDNGDNNNGENGNPVTDVTVDVPASLDNGETGHYIDAKDGEMNTTINGDSTIRGGATGTVVDHVTNSTIDSMGNLDVAGTGSTGVVVNGDGNTLNQHGNNTVSDGGTGNKVSGDGNTVHQTGDTHVADKGSTGSSIAGDNNGLVVDGGLWVENEATGAQIDGSGGAVTVNGPVHVDNASGIVINGEGGTSVINGNTDVLNGGTGVAVTGASASVTNAGALSVDGAGSAGVRVNGDGANVAQNGSLHVTNAGTGFDITGDAASVKNTAEVSVEDAGSVGVNLAGSNGTFSNAGDWSIYNQGQAAAINGTHNAVDLDGNVNVIARLNKADASVLDGATGVVVGGDGNQVNITGNVTLSNDPLTEQITAINASANGKILNGVTVSGNDNHVTLDGALAGSFNDPAGWVRNDTTGTAAVALSHVTSQLLSVSGENNAVDIKGGVRIDNTSYSNAGVSGISVTGNNLVTLSGDSSVITRPSEGDAVPNEGSRLLSLGKGSQVVFTDASNVTVQQFRGTKSSRFASVIFIRGGDGSAFTNSGVIDATASEMTPIIYTGNHSTFTNAGTVKAQNGAGADDGISNLISDQAWGTVINAETGLLQVAAMKNVGNYTGGAIIDTERYNSITALSSGGTILNAGRIALTGPAYGMVSIGDGIDGTEGLTNRGIITLDGYIGGVNPRALDGFGAEADKMRMGAGILGRNGSVNTVNTGSITVTNGGAGMMASSSGAVATNQGIITLDLMPGVTDSHDQLYGMVAVEGGTVVNGENGKIIITKAASGLTADGGDTVAHPFYKDANAASRIVNMGQICIDDACEDSTAWNAGQADVSDAVVDGGLLSATGETRDLTRGLAVLPGQSVSNAGTLSNGALALYKNTALSNGAGGTIASDIGTAGRWVSVTNDGTLSGSVNLKDIGSVFANGAGGAVTGGTTLGSWGNLTNAGTLGDLTLKDHSFASNTGTLDGAVTLDGNSGLVNAGTLLSSATDRLSIAGILVNQDGGVIRLNKQDIALGGTLYNQKGGLIDVGTAAHGPWLNDAGRSQFINSGTVTGGGAGTEMLVGLAQTNTTAWNTQDGSMTFSAVRANGYAVVNGGNGAQFINDGTINISGKNGGAVKVRYGSRAVNNGTINLGVAGDGSTALIGMLLDNTATTDAVAENNGTININASNSFAFSRDGANGRIINNGSVVIADGVTGSGILKQAGQEATIETGVHADFTRPALPDMPRPSINASAFSGQVLTNADVVKAIFPTTTAGGTIINTASGDMQFGGGSALNGGTFWNQGRVSRVSDQRNTLFSMGGDGTQVINDGTASSFVGGPVDGIAKLAGSNATFWNAAGGQVEYRAATATSAPAIQISGASGLAINDGTLSLAGNGATGMEVLSADGRAINNGTINLGASGTADTGMTAMHLGSNTGANAVVENNGTININANDSFAFSKEGSLGRVINNGSVVIADGVAGSGIIRQADLAGSIESGTHADYANPTRPSGQASVNVIEGYTIGTSASGYAGRLSASNALLKDVTVDTGFTAGTASRTMIFNDVVTGKNIQGADNIHSESAVWQAKSGLNGSGNVDVTLTKNNYADVAQDKSVTSVANALDSAYTNNSLFNSLNVKTGQDLSKALRQISGAQATSAFNDARVLTSRFDRLADTAPSMGNGLAFNVISRNDQRAELGNNVRYDMFALKQSFALDAHQALGLEYGLARLDGSGSKQAGDNGLTGGYSQFMGLKHTLSFGEGYDWVNSLRYDRHELDSNRSIRFGGVNTVATANNSQQYMEYRTEGSKEYALAPGLSLTPSLGLKFRHTVNGALNERGAGDFNLALNSSTETAVDSVVGLKLSYVGDNGWSATAKLEGGPNLGFSKSQRTGSLQGARGVNFNLDDGQKGGGINGVAEMGVNYSAGNKTLSVNAFQWQEDTITDKGLLMNYNLKF